MIEEVVGRPYADVITERLMTPAGQPRWLAIPEDEQGDIKDVFDVGDPIDPAEFKALHGVDMPETEVTNEALRVFNDPMVRAGGHPGGGGIASASSMAGWYQAILHDRGDILRPEVKTARCARSARRTPIRSAPAPTAPMPSRSRAPMTRKRSAATATHRASGPSVMVERKVRSAGRPGDRYLARLHDPRPRPQRSRRRASRDRDLLEGRRAHDAGVALPVGAFARTAAHSQPSSARRRAKPSRAPPDWFGRRAGRSRRAR